MGRISSTRLAALVAVLILLPVAAAAPPAAATEADLPPVQADFVDVQVDISHHYATTHVDTTLTNPAQEAQEFTLRIATGEWAYISRFAITVEGKTYESEVKGAESAAAEYEEARSSGSAAGLVTGRNTNLRLVRVSVPAETTVTTHLVYEELLYRTLGQYTYRLPLVDMSGGLPFDELRVEGEVAGLAAITVWNVSDGETRRVNHASFEFSFLATDYTPDEAYVVRWTEEAPNGAGLFMTRPMAGGIAFVHVFSGDGAGLQATPMAKDIVFVIDTSGSMRGTKIEQAKEAFNGVLDDLRPEDRFSVVLFSSSSTVMDAKLETATAEKVSAAQSWVDAASAGGGTNIDGGLADALSLLAASTTRSPIVVLLTDGRATAGVTDSAGIRANLVSRNTAGAAVFTLGFGTNADETLLRQIAIENHGAYRRVYESKDASAQIAGFYSTFGTPLLTNVSVHYTPEPLWSSPDAVDAAYSGSDITVVGLLPEGTESVAVEVRGETGGGVVTFSMSYGPPLADGGPAVERAAAYARLRALEDLALVGEAGAAENATALALEYGFVSQFTSLVVVAPEEFEAVLGVPVFPSDGAYSAGVFASGYAGRIAGHGQGPPAPAAAGTPPDTTMAPSPVPLGEPPAPAGAAAEGVAASMFILAPLLVGVLLAALGVVAVGALAVRRRSAGAAGRRPKGPQKPQE